MRCNKVVAPLTKRIEAKEISLPRFFMNSSVWFQKTNSITLPIAAGADIITISVIVGRSRSTTIVGMCR